MGLTSSLHDLLFYIGTLTTVRVGVGGHLHSSLCEWILLFHKIRLDRGTVQGGPLLNAPGQITGRFRMVLWNLLQVVHRTYWQPISPHVPIIIFITHL